MGKRLPQFSIAERMAMLAAGDAIVLFFSLLLAFWVWSALYRGPEFSLSFIMLQKSTFLLVIPWLFISLISDSYSSKNMSDFLRALKQPMQTTLLVCMIYAATYFFAPRNALPRAVVLFFGAISCSLLMLWRVAHFVIFAHRSLRERILVIGDEADACKVRKFLEFRSKFFELAGFISLHAITEPESLMQIMRINPDRIVNAASEMQDRECLKALVRVREAGFSIVPFPLFCEQLTRRTPVDHIEDNLAFLPMREESRSFYYLCKRLLDIVGALIGFSFFAIIFPFLAIAIKSDSAGPIFFSQIRVGKNGRRFTLWKLRTMVTDAEDRRVLGTEERDIRVTRAGKILRKVHLDEIPQMWNLLKGDVSVVGVRPLTVAQCEYFEKHIPYHNLRHLVKPGLTGWAVVNLRYANDLESAKVRLEYDLYYVKYHSLWLDLYIIFRTLWSIMTMSGI